MSHNPSELYQWLLRNGEEPPPVALRVDPDDTTEVTIVHEEAPVPHISRKSIFRHHHAHPIVLDLLLLQKYGHEWLGWEIETVERRVPQDFGVDRISDINVSKLQAVRTLHLVDDFWERWEVFTWVAMPLNGIYPDFQVMQVPSVLECMLAVDMANHIQTDVEWSEEVKQYLAAVHLHDGIVVPQAPLRFVPITTGSTEYLSHPQVETRHGVLINELLLGGSPTQVSTADYPVDAAEVARCWADVRVRQKAPTGDTPEAEQLRRMLRLHNHLIYQREQLRLQLGVLHA